jgi:hypothetical protein
MVRKAEPAPGDRCHHGAGCLPAACRRGTGHPLRPYFGKNQVRYDNFKWSHYETDHFIIYYYPEIEPHLERMAGYAESAYQHISSELKHDLAFKVPLILFQTASEFQEQNVVPVRPRKGRCLRGTRRAIACDADGCAA